MHKKKVAVIGAGAAGLAALRHLSTDLNNFQPVAFEQTSTIGGTWIYTDDVGVDRNGLPIHSSMYKYLHTNLPKEVMAFPDFPFADCLPSFLKHSDVLGYLEQYAEHFQLLKFVKFEHFVEQVRPIKELPDNCDNSSNVTWEITYRNLNTDDVTVDYYHAVMVCNGHFSKPLIPDNLDLSLFRGQIIHSHVYRKPEDFYDKSVIVLGAGNSGTDIAVELCSQAKKVYLCHNMPEFPAASLHEKVVQQCGIKQLAANGAILNNSEFLEADTLIFCTGYHYSFPFLSPECRLEVTPDEMVTPLYKHLINAHHPTMSLIGIPKHICPFPMFDCQVQFFIAYLSGHTKLPTVSDMTSEVIAEYQEFLQAGKSLNDYHTMDRTQWTYYDSLLAAISREPLRPVIRRIWAHTVVKRKNDIHFKQMNFEIVDDHEFVEL